MQELLKTQPRLLPLLLEEFFAIVGLVSPIRLHLSRLAFCDLQHKIPGAVGPCPYLAHLQAKSHSAEARLLSKLWDGVTTLEQASLHDLHRLCRSQISQRGPSTHLRGPLLRLLLSQFHAFLRPQILPDTVLHSTEFLNRRWTDRRRLEHIVRATLPLLSIDAQFWHGK